jgi:hypothetical protein
MRVKIEGAEHEEKFEGPANVNASREHWLLLLFSWAHTAVSFCCVLQPAWDSSSATSRSCCALSRTPHSPRSRSRASFRCAANTASLFRLLVCIIVMCVFVL